jgi:hypothetical protein
MPGVILLFIFILFLTGWASYAISSTVYKKLVKAGNANASVFRAVTMIGSFIIILATIFIVLVLNIRIER